MFANFVDNTNLIICYTVFGEIFFCLKFTHLMNKKGDLHLQIEITIGLLIDFMTQKNIDLRTVYLLKFVFIKYLILNVSSFFLTICKVCVINY